MLPSLNARIIEAAACVQPNDLQLIPIAQRSFFPDGQARAARRNVLHLLSLTLPQSRRPIFPLLLANPRRRDFRIWALEAPIDAIVPGTERAERYILWPMGIASAGAMRQWGSHATAFVGRRHLDDPFLLDRALDR